MTLAALDTLFTKITAVIMHVTNGAKSVKMPKEIGDDNAPPATPEELKQIEVDSVPPQKTSFAERAGTAKPVAPVNSYAELAARRDDSGQSIAP